MAYTVLGRAAATAPTRSAPLASPGGAPARGRGLHLEYPTQVVFDSVTLGINEGDRIGIVGRNGDGKSSLLRLLAGRLQPDSGRVTRRSGVRVGVLDQADTLDAAAPSAGRWSATRPSTCGPATPRCAT